jgi:hypothetical protein
VSYLMNNNGTKRRQKDALTKVPSAEVLSQSS